MKKILVIPLIILLFILGIIIGQKITRTEDMYAQTENLDEDIVVEEPSIENAQNDLNNAVDNSNDTTNEVQKGEISYNIEGEFEPNYDDIFPGYVGTAFRYIFKEGQVTYYTDGKFEGYYTIEDNKLKTVFTKNYNPATGEPEEPEYLKGEVMTIIDENTLQNDEGLNFYKR